MKRLHFLPANTRLRLRVLWRYCRDWGGQRWRFANTQQTDNGWPPAITVQQAITGGEHYNNKLYNLQMAANCLQGAVIGPGQVFSFWHWVGQPSEAKGYRPSRSIVQGQLVAATGGGLCQLSGLVYLLALKAGMQVTERHAHSLDIYREEERFAPLGSDATVAYGYKDLRFVNPLPHPIGLWFHIGTAQLVGSITCAVPLAEKDIHFTYNRNGQTVQAVTMANGTALCTNTYRCLHPAVQTAN
jgi:vancomycin resistance protein VanW